MPNLAKACALLATLAFASHAIASDGSHEWTKTGRSIYLCTSPEVALSILGSTEHRDGLAAGFAVGKPDPRFKFMSVPAQLVWEFGAEAMHGLPAPGFQPVDRAAFFAAPYVRFRGRTGHGVGAYADIGMGLYFTEVSHDVNLEVNTMPVIAFGAAFRRGKNEWLVGARFRHSSNGGIHRPNYGLNTLQLVITYRI